MPETQHVPIQNMKQSFVFSLTPSTRKQEAKATWQSQWASGPHGGKQRADGLILHKF